MSDYQDPIKRLILAKGFSDTIASQQLGALIWQHTNIKHQQFDLLIPIPLHWTRYAHRGYNQAHEMATTLSVLSGKPVLDALKRKRQTTYQAELSQELRVQNVKNVFELNNTLSDSLTGKHIVLVDDLMTTGSTLREAGRALLVAKPASITVVVAARVI